MTALVKFFLKLFFYFSISYLFLGLPLGKSPIFYHLYSLTSPYTDRLFFGNKENSSLIESSFKKPLLKYSKIIRKFFLNTLPEDSSPKESQEIEQEEYQESYTIEEKQFLKKILEKDSR